MRNAGLGEAQAGIKIARRNINNLRYADDNHPYGRKWRGTKKPLDDSESVKVGLKLNIQKTKIMASGPITSWQIDGETVRNFILGGSKVTVDDDCNHEIKRRLLLGLRLLPVFASWKWVRGPHPRPSIISLAARQPAGESPASPHPGNAGGDWESPGSKPEAQRLQFQPGRINWETAPLEKIKCFTPVCGVKLCFEGLLKKLLIKQFTQRKNVLNSLNEITKGYFIVRRKKNTLKGRHFIRD